MIGSVPHLRHRRPVHLAAVAVLLSTAMGWGAAGLGAAGARAISLPDGPSATPTVAGSDVQLDWTTVSLRDGHDAGSFRVVRTATGGAASTVGGSCAGTVAALTCTDIAVPEGYWQYAVAVVQGAWEGAAGPAVTAAVPLDAPTGLTGTLSGSQLTLTWSDQSDLETGYRIERSTDAGATWATAADLAAGSTSHVLTGLACDTTYQHRVLATHTDAALHSAPSGAVTTVAASCAPTMTASIYGSSSGLYSYRSWGTTYWAWDARAHTTVRDQAGNRVGSAWVYLQLTYPNGWSTTAYCVTNWDGRCDRTWIKISTGHPYVDIRITNVAKSGYTYTAPSTGAPTVRVHQARGTYWP